jgi:uncharacterized protein (TIGR03435 family)
MKAAVLFVLGIVAVAIPIFSQAPVAGRPQFDVVSIRVQPPPLTRIMVTQPPGRFVAEGFSLKMLAGRAYGVPEVRVFGGPSWVESERYAIEAKAAGTIPPGEMNLMLQSMLEDRFQLKAHKETRDLPVYELVVARGGSKMKLSEDQTPLAPVTPQPPPPGAQRGAAPVPPGAAAGAGPGPGTRGGPFGGGPPPRGMFTAGFGNVQGTAIEISGLVNFLVKQLGRPVTDKTGLTGLYDVKLEWTPGSEQVPGPFGPNPNAPPPPADPSGPSLFTALQEQLGLRLESAKGAVEVLVIDSAEKPTEN